MTDGLFVDHSVGVAIFFQTSGSTNFVVYIYSTTNLNNNAMFNFDNLYKDVINVTKYILTRNI